MSKLSLGYRIGTLPNRDAYAIGVYAVFLNEENKIVAISKHPCCPRSFGDLNALKKEIALYAQASCSDVFDVDAFGHWQYFMINSWEEEYITDERLNEMLIEWEKNI
jgi:hypothetical protein